jgi:cyclohexanone monooxygenase
MDNFNILVSGGDQEEDLVADGWTEIFRNLTGIAAKTAARELGRRLSSKEKGTRMELLDFQKMNQVRARVDDIVTDPATAAALKPWYRQFCKRPCFHDEYLPTFNRPNVTLTDFLLAPTAPDPSRSSVSLKSGGQRAVWKASNFARSSAGRAVDDHHVA